MVNPAVQGPIVALQRKYAGVIVLSELTSQFDGELDD